jgi:diguanylate cyclase (GGDEF)-like protein
MMSAFHLQVAGETSIIVVDDAKFTCEMIRRVLQGAGFHDIRTAHSGVEAMEMMRQRKVNILVADWLMPEMDGLELTQRVRQFDEENNHYTYVILLTAKDDAESLAEAFSKGVDDFISKSHDSTQLLARISAAGRISQLQSNLISANRRLAELNRHLEEHHCFDAVTGLGNQTYLERQLDNTLRHIEARGGNACLVAIQINDLDLLKRRHGSSVCQDVIEAAASRLQQSVRPLDIVTRIGIDKFGLLIHQESRTDCHPNSFRRIFQVLNLRAYKTSVGFVTATASICMCRISASENRVTPREIITYTQSDLEKARETGQILVSNWPAE